MSYSNMTITGDSLLNYFEKNSQMVKLSDVPHGSRSHTGCVLSHLKSQRGSMLIVQHV